MLGCNLYFSQVALVTQKVWNHSTFKLLLSFLLLEEFEMQPDAAVPCVPREGTHLDPRWVES